jgi:hypothetical protein
VQNELYAEHRWPQMPACADGMDSSWQRVFTFGCARNTERRVRHGVYDHRS